MVEGKSFWEWQLSRDLREAGEVMGSLGMNTSEGAANIDSQNTSGARNREVCVADPQGRGAL